MDTKKKARGTSGGGKYIPSQTFIDNLSDDVHVMFICTSDSNPFTVSGCKPNNAMEATETHAITNTDRLNRSRFIVAVDNEAATLPDDGSLPSRFRTRGLKMTGEVYFGNGMMLSSDDSSSSSSGGDNNNLNSTSSGGSGSDNSGRRNSDSSGDSSDGSNDHHGKNNGSVGSGSDSDMDMGKLSNRASPAAASSISSFSSSSSSSSSNVSSAAAAGQGNGAHLPIKTGGSVRRSTSTDSSGLPGSLSTGSTGSDTKGSCVHGRRRYTCKMCGGKGICRHNRQRYQCKDCGGGGICKHDRIRSQCKICGGGSICQHKRIRSVCKDCGGGSI